MAEILLSVVMPAHTDRLKSSLMYGQLTRQIGSSAEVEFLCLLDNGPLSTGKKLNVLYGLARGLYIAGVGDDDTVADDYIEALLNAIRENPNVDAICFDHNYFVDEHYVGYTAVSKDFKNENLGEFFKRRPTPKCAIHSEICKRFECPDISDREDEAFSEWVDGQIETEVRIERPLYNHFWTGDNKRWRRQEARRWERS